MKQTVLYAEMHFTSVKFDFDHWWWSQTTFFDPIWESGVNWPSETALPMFHLAINLQWSVLWRSHHTQTFSYTTVWNTDVSF